MNDIYIQRRGKGRKVPKKTKPEETALKAFELQLARRGECIVCKNPKLRFIVADLASYGVGCHTIADKLKLEYGIHQVGWASIKHHLEDHESLNLPWLGLVKSQFPTEDERKRFENAFLGRVSFITEMWDKYSILAEIFSMVAGSAGSINYNTLNREKGIDAITKLGGELREYLEDMIQLQRERDIILSVSKVVLFYLSNNLIEKLAVMLTELSPEKREIVGILIRDEVKLSIQYAKKFSTTKVENLIEKINTEYEKLVTPAREQV
jgi:hypothetical protein